jgi:hypothetical protein
MRCKVVVMKLLACLLLLSSAAFAKVHIFQTGKLISVSTEDRLFEGTTVSHALLTVQVDDVIYTVRGERVTRRTKDFSEGLIVGDSVQTSVEGNNIFLHKPDGKDMKTEILKRERSVSPKQ